MLTIKETSNDRYIGILNMPHGSIGEVGTGELRGQIVRRGYLEYALLSNSKSCHYSYEEVKNNFDGRVKLLESGTTLIYTEPE